MTIGFIGAGKMGFTLGKHLKLYEDKVIIEGEKAYRVAGFYSRTAKSARQAAEFTDTNYYESIEELVKDCDALIITVPDGQIYSVFCELKALGRNIEGRLIIHTSGALSSQIFSGTDGIYPYSVHPIYAVSSKTESYKNFRQCFITIEGHEKYIHFLEDIFKCIGHSVKLISERDKVKYHSGAVFVSNLVIALYEMGVELLTQCGFEKAEAETALKPLFINNSNRLFNTTPAEALTGPVERCDTETVRKHLDVLADEYRDIYRQLSLKLVKIAASKGKSDYEDMKRILNS